MRLRYGRAEFWDDLKKLYHICGVEEREVAFLLTDSQIVDEVFLEDISNILISGEVPGNQQQTLQASHGSNSCTRSSLSKAAAHLRMPGLHTHAAAT